MCEYCDLVSGEDKDIEEGFDIRLHLERHCNTYSLIAESSNSYAEKEINYCFNYGKKLGENNENRR